MKNKSQLEKRRHYVRDIFTGKIISDKEAVSIENIHLVTEKLLVRQNE